MLAWRIKPSRLPARHARSFLQSFDRQLSPSLHLGDLYSRVFTMGEARRSRNGNFLWRPTFRMIRASFILYGKELWIFSGSLFFWRGASAVSGRSHFNKSPHVALNTQRRQDSARILGDAGKRTHKSQGATDSFRDNAWRPIPANFPKNAQVPSPVHVPMDRQSP